VPSLFSNADGAVFIEHAMLCGEPANGMLEPRQLTVREPRVQGMACQLLCYTVWQYQWYPFLRRL